jgi:hypothetical protein
MARVQAHGLRDAIEFPKKDERKIVRPVDLTQAGTGKKLASYSLGHDVLGGVLERWKQSRNDDYGSGRKGLVWSGATIVLVAFAMTSRYVIYVHFHYQRHWPTSFSLSGSCFFAAGRLSLLLAAIANSRPFAVYMAGSTPGSRAECINVFRIA